MTDKNYVGIFKCRDDPAMVGTRWVRWLTAFELFADGKGLIITGNSATNKQQRRAQLLHFTGPDVQDCGGRTSFGLLTTLERCVITTKQ